MPNVLELKQRATELKTEVGKALKDCEAGTITPAELSGVMDKAETEDKSIAEGIKAYNRAVSWRGGAADESGDDGQDGKPPIVGASNPYAVQAKANGEQYKMLAERAKANLASKGNGTGSFHFDIHMKDQGQTGLQGEQTSGTTGPPTGTLDQGAYFYTGTAGPAIEPEFIPGIAEMRYYPNVVASLIPNYPVNSPIVTYVKEVLASGGAYVPGWDNKAEATKEAETKPTSGDDVTRFTENIGKIANLMRVTDEMIQDAPYFWSLVQRRGVEGVARKEEVALLAGSGLPGVNGLLNRSAKSASNSYPSGFTAPETVTAITDLVIGGATGSGAQTSTVSSVTPGRKVSTVSDQDKGITLAEAMLDAIYDIRVNWFFEPDALIFNPLDWKTIRLAKDQRGQYMGGSFFGTNYGVPQDSGSVGIFENLSLWSKRVVSTPVQPQGLGLTGDFQDAAQVLRLGGLRVDITNLNGTDFEQNLWTMRVEERVGLLVDRPELFELVQFPGYGS